jgi:hypothetical protein
MQQVTENTTKHAAIALRPINQGPCLPRRLAFSLRAYFACGNMAARNEDFS